MNDNQHPPVIVVAGPTAGGKSTLSKRIASDLGVPIVSMDSMKVYRGMDIGTAKPTAADRANHKIHLLDVRDPQHGYSVGDFLRDFQELSEKLPEPWLLSGGTAFYLNALIEGINPGPPPDATFREQLAEEAERVGVAALHERLSVKDPVVAKTIHSTDLRRITRALEVIELCGEPMSEVQKRKKPVLPAGSYRVFGIARPREELYARINQRVEAMFERGWVDEVRTLMAAHDPPWGPEASQSIGYTIIREALESGAGETETVDLIQRRTRKFARSQLTWFRRLPVEWWRPEEHEELIRDLRRSLDDYSNTGTFPPPAEGRAHPEETLG